MTAIRGDLGVALRELDAAGFADYWRRHALPAVQAAIDAQLRAAARGYDVIGADEEILGRRLDTDRITVEVLATFGRMACGSRAGGSSATPRSR